MTDAERTLLLACAELLNNMNPDPKSPFGPRMLDGTYELRNALADLRAEQGLKAEHHPD